MRERGCSGGSVICPQAEGLGENGGEGEAGDLPEPDAGEEEADPEGGQSEEGAD